MKFLKRLTLAYNTVSGLFLIAFTTLFLLRLIPMRDVLDMVYLSYVDDNLRLAWAGVLVIALLFNYLLFRMLSKSDSDKQVIPFESPSGKVRVSVFALEELAKRVAHSVQEVQSVQVKMEKHSKGLDVDLKLSLCCEANILEVTSRVQNLVRRRIQETISLDQPVNVSAYVSKIDSMNSDSKTQKTKSPYTDIHVPFQGYRA